MILKQSVLLPLTLFSMSGGRLSAQLWFGRAVDWATVGILGGIPQRDTTCSTLTTSATVATINAAIAACPSGQAVMLSAGAYTLSAGMAFKNHDVTLRETGADKTFLKFTGKDSCGLPEASDQIEGSFYRENTI
jgi:hypothetical protein